MRSKFAGFLDRVKLAETGGASFTLSKSKSNVASLIRREDGISH